MLAEQMCYVKLAKLKPFHLKHKMIVVFLFLFFSNMSFILTLHQLSALLPEAVISSALLSFPSHHMLFNLLFQP